jgi:hypothetical protein
MSDSDRKNEREGRPSDEARMAKSQKEENGSNHRAVGPKVIVAVLILVPAVLWLLFNWSDICPSNERLAGFRALNHNNFVAPGDIIEVSSCHAGEPVVLISRERVRAEDSTIVEMTPPEPVPYSSFYRDQRLVSDVAASTGTSQILEAKGYLEGVQSVKQEVNAAHTLSLKSGTAVFESELSRRLPGNQLNMALKEKSWLSSVEVVTDILRFEDASIEILWESEFNTALKNAISQYLNVGGDNRWLNNNRLILKYDGATVVGYRSKSLQITDVGETSDTKWYRDRDDDGFGDESVFEYRDDVPQEGWTTTGKDCSDRDPYVKPVQTRYFEEPYYNTGEGKPSFDYNCDGVVEPERKDIAEGCQGSGRHTPGWINNGSYPKCGESAQWLTDCTRYGDGRLQESVVERTQSCR